MIRALAHRLRPLVDLRVSGLERLTGIRGPVILVANHAHDLDGRLIGDACPPRLRPSGLPPALALTARRSVLLFPEHGVSPDSTVGRFHDDAAALAQSHGVPIVPVAVRGTFALPRSGGIRAVRSRNHLVFVRFGDPIPTDRTIASTTAQLRDAVVALLREDASTWWETATSAPTGDREAGDSWLVTWDALEPVSRTDAPEQARIWA